MKKHILICALLSAFIFTGATCRNQTPTDVAYKTEGVIITTVDSTMKAWADYVKSGQATQKEVDTVKALYNDYRNAQILAGLAVDAYFAAGKSADKEAAVIDATKNVSLAKNALLDLVPTLIHK